VGEPPIIRVDSELLRLEDYQILSQDAITDLVKVMLSESQQQRLAQQMDLDFSYAFKDDARFRVNVFRQQGVLGAAFRLIPNHIKTLEELNLPPILKKFTENKQGLVLVVGPTGHGKSTALASMINEINLNRAEHILTIEDPVEFLFTPQKSVISQREVNLDTPSFAQALKAALREDINVVLVGEIRDLESISSALTLAETGHLIFATMHTNDAAQSIDRIVDVFSGEQQNQIRSQLASVLLGVVSLRLLPKVGGGRIPAYEIMVVNHAVRNTIRDNKIYEINNIIHTSMEEGMVPLDKTLSLLVKQGLVELDVAQNYVLDKQINEPRQVKTAQILVSYKDAPGFANNSKETLAPESKDLTRTKEEAKARAEEVLAKLNNTSANPTPSFEELVKQYSDHSSKNANGVMETAVTEDSQDYVKEYANNRSNSPKKIYTSDSMIIPNTFKLNEFIAWVIMTEETYKTFTTSKIITDVRIHLPNSYLLFIEESFVNVNTKNIMITFGKIIQRKYDGW
jgi:twitching motility protein PilT